MKKNNSISFEKLKQYDLKIHYPCEDIIEELKAILDKDLNAEVNLYYEILNMENYQTAPEGLEDWEDELQFREYPLYIDFEVGEENKSKLADLKHLKVVKVLAMEALEIFKFQNKKTW